MNFPRTLTCAIILGAIAVMPQPTLAGGEPRVGKISNPLVAEECSACHMAFQPGFLPMRSWRTIMRTLPHHYGEDASLSESDRAEIEKYMMDNAADANGKKPRFMRKITDTQMPMRITEFRWFKGEHGTRLRNWAAKQPEIGTLTNCKGCHKGADRGYFDDD